MGEATTQDEHDSNLVSYLNALKITPFVPAERVEKMKELLKLKKAIFVELLRTTNTISDFKRKVEDFRIKFKFCLKNTPEH